MLRVVETQTEIQSRPSQSPQPCSILNKILNGAASSWSTVQCTFMQATCLEHKTTKNHGCTKESVVERTAYTGERSYPCSIENCQKKELTPIICQHCSLHFCLDHRLQEDHQCTYLPEAKPLVSKTTQHVQEILAQRPAQSRPQPKLTNPKSIAMAAKVNLMKLKSKSLGDQGLPQSERIYFNVYLPRESGKPAIPMFFSKVWSTGRIIDVIADKTSITNNNNTSSSQKLRLFHGDTGSRLPLDQSLSAIMEDPDFYLHNGANLVLELVPEDLEVLDNVDSYKK